MLPVYDFNLIIMWLIPVREIGSSETVQAVVVVAPPVVFALCVGVVNATVEMLCWRRPLGSTDTLKQKHTDSIISHKTVESGKN